VESSHTTRCWLSLLSECSTHARTFPQMCPALFIVHVGTSTSTHVCVKTLPHEGEPTNNCLHACLWERMRISSHVDARVILLHGMRRTLGAFLPSMTLRFPCMCTQTHLVMFVQIVGSHVHRIGACGHVSACVVGCFITCRCQRVSIMGYTEYVGRWLVSVTLAYRHVCHYMCGCTFTTPPPNANIPRLMDGTTILPNILRVLSQRPRPSPPLYHGRAAAATLFSSRSPLPTLAQPSLCGHVEGHLCTPAGLCQG